MIGLISSILMVVKDVSEELSKGVKYIFVSSDKEMLDKLKKLNVDKSKVKFFDTGVPVKDWSQVAGVFKTENNVYAYSKDIQSELGANLRLV